MIRRAGAADLAEVQARAREYFAEIGTGFSKPDRELLDAFVAETLARGFVLLAEEGGEFLGTVGLIRDRFPWSRQEFVNERWFYVRQDRPTGRAADDLARAAIAVAGAVGRDLWAAVVAGHRTAAHIRWRRRHGGEQMGGVFRFRAAPGSAPGAF